MSPPDAHHSAAVPQPLDFSSISSIDLGVTIDPAKTVDKSDKKTRNDAMINKNVCHDVIKAVLMETTRGLDMIDTTQHVDTIFSESQRLVSSICDRMMVGHDDENRRSMDKMALFGRLFMSMTPFEHTMVFGLVKGALEVRDERGHTSNAVLQPAFTKMMETLTRINNEYVDMQNRLDVMIKLKEAAQNQTLATWKALETTREDKARITLLLKQTNEKLLERTEAQKKATQQLSSLAVDIKKLQVQLSQRRAAEARVLKLLSDKEDELYALRCRLLDADRDLEASKRIVKKHEHDVGIYAMYSVLGRK